jgi:hypothetical protein
MHLIEVSTGKRHEIIIELVSEDDLKKVTKKKYSFKWKVEKAHMLYKLKIKGQDDILGLMSLEKVDEENRIEVRLLAVSAENIGKNKLFERIVGNLFAFACRLALKEYGQMGAISLIPKTVLGRHYMDKYGFEQAGKHLFVAGKELLHLLNEYDYD